MDLSDWTNTFRSWPAYTVGWRDWYRRISAKKQVRDTIEIGQCLALCLADMKRTEPLLIVASHFWSDALNAFLFRNGPMTMTRADIVMLTGLSVSEPFSPCRMFDETKHKLKPKERGGWTGYVSRHTKKGFVGDREHTAFLNMWLEKFIFCGTSVGPTSNYQCMAEQLARGKKIPLGDYLLGSAYSLLHQVGKIVEVGKDW